MKPKAVHQQTSKIDKPNLDTTESAAFLGCSPYTLRRSRSTGTLFGVPSPAYKKRGRSVCYCRATLESWDAQFQEQNNTAQNSATDAEKVA